MAGGQVPRSNSLGDLQVRAVTVERAEDLFDSELRQRWEEAIAAERLHDSRTAVLHVLMSRGLAIGPDVFSRVFKCDMPLLEDLQRRAHIVEHAEDLFADPPDHHRLADAG